MYSLELTRQIAGESPQGICSFSMGKDSIGAAIQMMRCFDRLEFVFLYMVPDLEFQNISLSYYESKFGVKIKRMPHPSIYRQLNAFMYQNPSNIDIIIEKNLYLADYDEVFSAAKLDLGMTEDSFVGVGVRSSDSLARRAQVKQSGGVNRKRRQFFPIYDWNAEKLMSEIRNSNILLPIDYRIWGRSFDGFDFRFLKPLKDNFPKDYEKVREFFPLIDLEIKRYSLYGK